MHMDERIGEVMARLRCRWIWIGGSQSREMDLGGWRWIWREKLPHAQICSSVAISRCPRGIRARHRLLETRPYNGSCVVSSALEHGIGALPREVTGSPSLGWAGGFSGKKSITETG